MRPAYFEPLLYALLLFPVVSLFLPLQTVSVVMSFTLTAAALVLAVGLFYVLFRGLIARLAAVGTVTALSLSLDLLRDAPLMKTSVLGYDVVSGARYYGLGNEYMGVLVGSALLGTAGLFQLYPNRRWLLPAVTLALAALVLFLVAPGGGANFGGTLTAAAAFPVTLLAIAQIRLGWRSGAGLAALFLGFALLALFLNMRVPVEAQSHLGRTLALMASEGWQALGDVVSRKAAMNARLFRYSQWSRAFVVFILVLVVLFWRPRGVLAQVRSRFPLLSAGFPGIIAGSITAFLLNDSGVVAGATTLLYAGVPVILLCGRAVEADNRPDN